ncbi:MAG: VIT domain-containing protein [Kiritimatiellia bacterium]
MKRHSLIASIAMLAAASAPAQGFLQVKTADGDSPVRLERLSVKAAVKGLHAAVDSEFTFRNPNRRILEGELEFPLPDGATVSGYAIDINGAMTDGVVVKKEKARVVFETEARRRIDPGIVEHVKGNLYKTRIYPLPANGTRTVRVSYTTPLAIGPDGDAALRLAMPRERIGQRNILIEVDAGGDAAPELGGLGDRRFEKAESFWRVSAEETDVEPAGDVVVALPKLPPQLAGVEKDRDGAVWFYASTLAPKPAEKSQPPPAAIDILWDASGSRESDERKLDFALVNALPASAKYRVTVFRNTPEPAQSFASPAEVVAYLKDVPNDGGTDFAALAAALDDADPAACRLLFTDGLDTLADQPLAFAGAKPVAIVSSMVADHESLRQACGGALIDLQTTTIPDAVAQIVNPPPRVAGIVGTGVADVQGVGRPAAGRVTILGRLTAPEAQIKIDFGNGAESAPFHLRAESAREAATLRQAWAAMRVAQLAPRADDFADELLALGRAYGVVSPATSLIVLESLDQWVRHDIEPPESLPELRERWRAALKGRADETESKLSRHLAMLERLWKERVDWLKRDFSKLPLPETQPEDGAPRPPVEPRRRLFSLSGSSRRSEARMPANAMADADLGEPVALAAIEEEPADEMNMRAARAPSGTGRAIHAYGGGAPSAKAAPGGKPAGAVSSIEIKAWDPKTPYLDALKKADAAGLYAAYLKQKETFGKSPAFYLDCADHCFNRGETALGTKILTNLAELKIEDAALLRVFAWRLRQAEQYELAVRQFRRVVKLRGEDPQSYRDLALTLAEWGKATRDAARLEEAMALYVKVAFTPWTRHADTLGLFALEELNALVSWIEATEWKDGAKPAVPAFDAKFREPLQTDLRIMIAWDADNTDIDLHVVEPGGEEAFYGHNRTTRGGLVSRDVTDGYGPEEYLIAKAPAGDYSVLCNYFASHQQTVLGPATVTATIFTNWGRPDETRQTLAVRLDTPKDKVPLGTVRFGKDDGAGGVATPQSLKDLAAGMTTADAEAILGAPARTDSGLREYPGGGGSVIKVQYDTEGRLLRAERHFPGGVVMILAQ